MNNTVRQPVTIEIAMASMKQPQQPKGQNTDDAKFMNMLSDALNNNKVETAKQPESAKESTDTANESEQPLTQENPETEAPVIDQDDSIVYDEQTAAVAVAMQMQGMFPVIAETPQTETTDDFIAVNQLVGTQSEQTIQSGMAAQAEVAAADGFQAHAAKDIPHGEPKAETVTAEMPKAAETAPETETLTVQPKPETTVSTGRTEEDAPDMQINRQEQQPQAEQPQGTARQKTDAAEQPEDTAAVIETDGETETIRQSRPAAPMHQIINPGETEAAQAKFDGMLERASQELNQNAAVQKGESKAETLSEIADEIPKDVKTAEQPVQTESKPQETVKQAEAKLPEEAKPAEQAAQKNVRAVVTDQKPQNEISKEDEALLGMTQQKQPEIKHEIIRNEPAPQPQQPRAERPDQAEQIKAQVIRSMENNRTEFQMQLHPEELGKVNVKMILEGGKLSVEIAAVNPKSAEMLSRQAESLAMSLKASGADVSSVSVVTANENASAQMDGEYNLNNFQNRFKNQENGQNQQGRSRGSDGTGEQDKNAGQKEREAPKAPLRILNYSV